MIVKTAPKMMQWCTFTPTFIWLLEMTQIIRLKRFFLNPLWEAFLCRNPHWPNNVCSGVVILYYLQTQQWDEFILSFINYQPGIFHTPYNSALFICLFNFVPLLHSAYVTLALCISTCLKKVQKESYFNASWTAQTAIVPVWVKCKEINASFCSSILDYLFTQAQTLLLGV